MMKTIKERAREFIEKVSAGPEVPSYITYINGLLAECFCLGAEEEHLLLTEWHDLTEEMPEDGHLVLLKITFRPGFMLAEHERSGWRQPGDEWRIPDDQIISWREIHE